MNAEKQHSKFMNKENYQSTLCSLLFQFKVKIPQSLQWRNTKENEVAVKEGDSEEVEGENLDVEADSLL